MGDCGPLLGRCSEREERVRTGWRCLVLAIPLMRSESWMAESMAYSRQPKRRG